MDKKLRMAEIKEELKYVNSRIESLNNELSNLENLEEQENRILETGKFHKTFWESKDNPEEAWFYKNKYLFVTTYRDNILGWFFEEYHDTDISSFEVTVSDYSVDGILAFYKPCSEEKFNEMLDKFRKNLDIGK